MNTNKHEQHFSKMPRYPAYKDSGVEWLGEIPEGWTVSKLKFIDEILMGQSPDSNDCNSHGKGTPFLQGNAEFGPSTPSPKLWCTKPKKLCRAGNILFSVRAPVGALNIADQAYAIGRGLAAISVNHMQKGIRKYQLSSAVECLKKLITGSTFEAISIDDLKNLFIALPSHLEQRAIAAFLDEKTGKIDEAMAIKQQQIELLKERKQIIIQNAVTRGLNPDAPLRDSGIDWIGKIPKHWEVKRAKFLFKEIDERSINGDEELLSVSHLTGITSRSEKNVTMIAEDYSGSKTCKKNDLIMNIMWAWMGALGVSDRSGIVSSAYSVFRQTPGNIFNPVFLEWLLKTTGYMEHYNRVSTGLHSSRLRFYSRMFFDMEIGFPDRAEQDSIVKHIENQASKIDKAVELEANQITALKEYKTTLINSAVTGKIRVPGVAEA
jgi:type I restriction enzyme S subunit